MDERHEMPEAAATANPKHPIQRNDQLEYTDIMSIIVVKTIVQCTSVTYHIDRISSKSPFLFRDFLE